MTYLTGVAFIVIGRNEGWKLELSLKSVFNAIQANAIEQYEVIYVDSDSSDCSVDIALGFPEVSVYRLSGMVNAAIARNTGAEVTQLSTLFFIDGDMEIEAAFLGSVVNSKGELGLEFVSGQLKNFNYDNLWRKTGESWQYNAVLSGDKIMSTCGGIFLVDHSLWDLAGAMDNRFKRGQDLDFSLKMAGLGKLLYRKHDVIARHHTISYTHQDRIWKTLCSGDILYSKSLLYRKHWAKKAMYLKMVQSDYSMVLMLACVLSIGLTKSVYWGLPYVGMVLMRVLKKKRQSFKEALNNLAFVPFRDALTLIGFLFFYPKHLHPGDYQVSLVTRNNTEYKAGQHE